MKTVIEISTVEDAYNFLSAVGLLPYDWTSIVYKQGGILLPWNPELISIIELFGKSSERTKLLKIFNKE